MSTTSKSPDPRKALTESERKASESQPDNFKDVETDEKVIEVLPIDGGDAAIKGIDPQK